jgi:hypothetical protein
MHSAVTDTAGTTSPTALLGGATCQHRKLQDDSRTTRIQAPLSPHTGQQLSYVPHSIASQRGPKPPDSAAGACGRILKLGKPVTAISRRQCLRRAPQRRQAGTEGFTFLPSSPTDQPPPEIRQLRPKGPHLSHHQPWPLHRGLHQLATAAGKAQTQQVIFKSPPASAASQRFNLQQRPRAQRNSTNKSPSHYQL